MFYKIAILKSSLKFPGKHSCWGHFLMQLHAKFLQLIKEITPALLFSYGFIEILRMPNTSGKEKTDIGPLVQ